MATTNSTTAVDVSVVVTVRSRPLLLKAFNFHGFQTLASFATKDAPLVYIWVQHGPLFSVATCVRTRIIEKHSSVQEKRAFPLEYIIIIYPSVTLIFLQGISSYIENMYTN